MEETKLNKGAESSAKLVDSIVSWWKNLSTKKNKENNKDNKKKFNFDYAAQKTRVENLTNEKSMKNLSPAEVKKAVKEKLSGVSSEQKSRQATLPKKEGMGGVATVSPNQKSRQATLPKKEGMGDKATVSSKQKSRQATLPKEEGIGARIARKLGDKRSEEEMIKTRKMNEEDEKEMGMNKGGMAGKKVYGMREGGFTKRGGMYKKGY